jgi:hypothetical protein
VSRTGRAESIMQRVTGFRALGDILVHSGIVDPNLANFGILCFVYVCVGSPLLILACHHWGAIDYGVVPSIGDVRYFPSTEKTYSHRRRRLLAARG